MSLTNQDLRAISQLLDEKLDKKLEEKLKPVYGRLDVLEEKVKTGFTALEDRVGKVETRLTVVENDLGSVKADLGSVKDRTKKIELLLENDTSPRLMTIESCYLDTYKRYCEHIDQIDTLQSDMEVAKATLERHSQILKKLA